jgi:hypothetical protein
VNSSTLSTNDQVYGYAGTYPGGTFEAVVDRPVAVTWRNHLPDTHFLPTQNLGPSTTFPSPFIRLSTRRVC